MKSLLRFSLAFFSILPIIASFSQSAPPLQGIDLNTTKTTWGGDYPREKNELNFQLLATDANAYHLLFNTKDTPPALLSFNDHHQLLKNQQYEMLAGISPLEFQGSIASSSDTLAFFTHYSAKNATQAVMVTSLRAGVVEKFKPLFSYQKPSSYLESPISFDRYNDLGEVSPLYRSPDGSKLAYVQCLSSRTLNNQSTLVIAVMEETGKLLWQRVVERKRIAEYITVLDAVVSNEGEVFLTTQLHSSKTFAVARNMPHIAGYRSGIFRINEHSIQDLDIYLGEGLVPIVSRLYLPTAQENVLIVSGFYNKVATETNKDGIFVNRFQLDQESYTTTTYSFADHLDEVGSQSDNKDWQSKLVLRDFFVLPNGQFGFVGEVAYVLPRGNGVSSIADYATHQLIIPWFDEQGALLQIATLPKKLWVQEPRLSSFALGVNGERLHFLYNTLDQDGRLNYSGKRKRNTIFTLARSLSAQEGWSAEQLVAVSTNLKKKVLARRAVFVGEKCFLPAVDRSSFQIGTVVLDR